MFKAVILLTRGADQSPEEFRKWWIDDHAPLASQLPLLRRLTFNLVDPALQDSSTDLPPYDGVSELWFDTRQDFDAAYQSEIGKKVASDSLQHVSGRLRLLVTEYQLVS